MTAAFSLKSVLSQIVVDKELHARLLNTLSYLEYIGARKILKSQASTSVSTTILKHANEELRHALILKRLSISVGGSVYETYVTPTVLCSDEAEGYFQSVDYGCEALLRERFANAELTRVSYYYVTWLIEIRALDVYAKYLEALSAAANPKVPVNLLENLMKEEDHHLDEVTSRIREADPLFESHRQLFQDLEQSAFDELVRHLAFACISRKEARSVCV